MHWWTVVAFAVLVVVPAIIVLAKSFRIRITSGPTCPKCGYNLYKFRGDECPECGCDVASTGVYPPHRIDRLPLILWVIAIVGGAMILTAIIRSTVRSSVHLANAETSVTFQYPQSLAYSSITVGFSGDTWRWGDWRSANKISPPQVPINAVTIQTDQRSGYAKIQVDPVTLKYQYKGQAEDREGRVATGALVSWLRTRGIEKPIDSYRTYLVMANSRNGSWTKEELSKLPVGDIADEMKLVVELIEWATQRDRQLNGPKKHDPKQWPAIRGIEATRASPNKTGPFPVVMGSWNGHELGPPPNWVIHTVWLAFWAVCPFILWKVFVNWRRGQLEPWMRYRASQETA